MALSLLPKMRAEYLAMYANLAIFMEQKVKGTLHENFPKLHIYFIGYSGSVAHKTSYSGLNLVQTRIIQLGGSITNLPFLTVGTSLYNVYT